MASASSFDVVLNRLGSRKIWVITAVRRVTNLGLADAKDIVDRAPSLIVGNVSRATAETIREEFAGLDAAVAVEHTNREGRAALGGSSSAIGARLRSFGMHPEG